MVLASVDLLSRSISATSSFRLAVWSPLPTPGRCPLGQRSGVVVVATELLLQVLVVEVAVVAVRPVSLLLPCFGIGDSVVDALYGLLVKCKGERPLPMFEELERALDPIVHRMLGNAFSRRRKELGRPVVC